MSNSIEASIASGAGSAARSRIQWRLDDIFSRACRAVVGDGIRGRLHLVLPSGVTTVLGGGDGGADAHLALKSYDVFWTSLRRGTIGVAESYIAGEIETDDLVSLFKFFIDNRQALSTRGRGLFRVRGGDRTYHARRANTHAGSRANIQAHYDLGNAFYAAWLDPSMTYSSALYRTGTETLEAAQAAKYAAVLDALALEPGHRVLEIGCGWGELAALVCGAGAHVTGLTLSEAQLAAAQLRLAGRGFAGQGDLRLQDYRDVQGRFDRIVSIEMLEAVGEENWPRYFGTLHDRLAPGGIAVLQAITIDEAIFDTYRRKADFIQRYIFPGGMLPTDGLIRAHAAATGLTCERVLNFGTSYALTLAEWRRRFDAAWPAIEAQGFDQEFRRMWTYYLTYCEAGFERGTIDVGLYRLCKATG